MYQDRFEAKLLSCRVISVRPAWPAVGCHSVER
jgi:hypothetical protein